MASESTELDLSVKALEAALSTVSLAQSRHQRLSQPATVAHHVDRPAAEKRSTASLTPQLPPSELRRDGNDHKYEPLYLQEPFVSNALVQGKFKTICA